MTTALNVRNEHSGDFRLRIMRVPGRVTIPNLILENINAGATRHFRSRPDLDSAAGDRLARPQARPRPGSYS